MHQHKTNTDSAGTHRESKKFSQFTFRILTTLSIPAIAGNRQQINKNTNGEHHGAPMSRYRAMYRPLEIQISHRIDPRDNRSNGPSPKYRHRIIRKTSHHLPTHQPFTDQITTMDLHKLLHKLQRHHISGFRTFKAIELGVQTASVRSKVWHHHFVQNVHFPNRIIIVHLIQ